MTTSASAERRIGVAAAGGLLAAGLLVLSACGSGDTESAAAPDVSISSAEIADGVFLFQGAGSNVLAMADGDDLLVIDGGLAANAKPLFSAIRQATGGEKIAVLIDTHWHPEQVGLNAQAGADGARIIAHQETCRALANRVASPLYEGEIAPLDEAARPTECPRDGGELTFAGHRVVYDYLPAAHTNGDLYVYIPDLDVLAAGGAVGSDSWPLVDYWNGGFIGGFMQGYEHLADLVDDDTTVVAALGPPITGAQLVEDRDMFAQLYRDLAYMMNKGMGYNDVGEVNPLHGHEDRFGDSYAFLNGLYRSKEMSEVPD